MSDIEKIIKKLDKARIQCAFNSLRQEDQIHKAPFFLGDQFIEWYLKKNNLEDVQNEVEQWYKDHNISIGLSGDEQHEMFIALKSLYTDMIEQRKDIIEAAATKFKKSAANVAQAPINFSISTQYKMNFSAGAIVMPKVEKPAKKQKPDNKTVPMLEEVKGLCRRDRIAMMLKAPVRRNNGRVNVMASSQAYDVGYKTARRHLQFMEEQNVAI